MSISRDEFLEWIKNCAAILKENREYLIDLDSAIGDGDHGANMDRGFRAVMSKMNEVEDKDIGTITTNSPEAYKFYMEGRTYHNN